METIIKYKVERNAVDILTMVVQKETKTMVIFVNGSREKKDSYWCTYFDAWEDAHSYLITFWENIEYRAKRKLDTARSNLMTLKDLGIIMLKPITYLEED